MCSKLWPPYGPWTPVAYTSSTKHTWCFCKRKKTLTKSRILGRSASSTASVTCSPSYSLLGWHHSCITWCYPTKVLSSVAVIHDNFRVVQSSVKLLHAQRTSSILLKVDIVKVFDTVNWSFLHDLLHHLGFSRNWPWTVLIGSAPKRRAVGVRHVLGLDYGLGRQRSLRSILA
jgi:hypothetical protein